VSRGLRPAADLAADNLDRVAATAEQVLEFLKRDAGLMVEFKRLLARDAGTAGQLLDETDLTDEADLVVPDGFPLVWLGRRKGYPLRRRVYGPELMERFCEETAAEGYRHFFYGGASGVAEDLAARLAVRFPGLQIAGAYCPPFRPLTQEEDEEEVSRINGACADIVWVGLGAPKQERWMSEHQVGSMRLC
jgi:exopolysaccharide biosynthesis WecB/TagA/CpsF family protein